MNSTASPPTAAVEATVAAKGRRRRRSAADRRRVRTTSLVAIVVGVVGFFVWSTVFWRWNKAVFAAPLLALTVAGSLVKLLPKKVGEGFAGWLDDVLSHPLTSGALLFVVGAAVAVSAGFLGAVQVESLQTESGPSRTVWLEIAEREPATLEVASGALARRPLLTSWWRPAEVVVRVSRTLDGGIGAVGEQSTTRTVAPFEREAIEIAEGFSHPVLLVRPTIRLLDSLSGLVTTVTVAHAGGEVSAPWRGELILIGCPEDRICVPGAVDEAELYEDLHAARPGLEDRWGRTLRLLPEGFEEEVTVRVEAAGLDHPRLAEARFSARDGRELQIEVLDGI